MAELPDKIDSHFDIITPGVESEEVEEINDAYKDILEELGNVMLDMEIWRIACDPWTLIVTNPAGCSKILSARLCG